LILAFNSVCAYRDERFSPRRFCHRPAPDRGRHRSGPGDRGRRGGGWLPILVPTDYTGVSRSRLDRRFWHGCGPHPQSHPASGAADAVASPGRGAGDWLSLGRADRAFSRRQPYLILGIAALAAIASAALMPPSASTSTRCICKVLARKAYRRSSTSWRTPTPRLIRSTSLASSPDAAAALASKIDRLPRSRHRQRHELRPIGSAGKARRSFPMPASYSIRPYRRPGSKPAPQAGRDFGRDWPCRRRDQTGGALNSGAATRLSSIWTRFSPGSRLPCRRLKRICGRHRSSARRSAPGAHGDADQSGNLPGH